MQAQEFQVRFDFGKQRYRHFRVQAPNFSLRFRLGVFVVSRNHRARRAWRRWTPQRRAVFLAKHSALAASIAIAALSF